MSAFENAKKFFDACEAQKAGKGVNPMWWTWHSQRRQDRPTCGWRVEQR